jgi:phosphate acetyltransferase
VEEDGVGFSEVVWGKERDVKARIVLPEANEERMQKAAHKAVRDGIAGEIIFLGDRDKLSREMREKGLNDPCIIYEDLENKNRLDEFTQRYFELRKHKGIRLEDAAEKVRDPLVYGALMVKLGQADGMVAGAMNTSGDVLRTAITVIGTREGYKNISTCAVMIGFKQIYGARGEFIFADVSLGPVTSASQLADTAIQSAESASEFLGEEPIVAMLSFSTKGSAQHEVVDKVIEATKIVKKRRPGLIIDGELQMDAAVVPEVAEKKCGDSPVMGRANVLIFPDLNAANIGVKIAERLGGGKCYGPILQGLDRPVNDLSRGCSFEDIVNVIAITASQSKRQQEDLG